MNYLKEKLENIYSTYNRLEYINPDPLTFLHEYPEKKNREIVGLIAACFAYGRVEMIMKTIESILDKLLPTPFEYLMIKEKRDMIRDFKGFRHRFAKDTDLISLLWGIRTVIDNFSSLENCFRTGWTREDETVLPGLIVLYEQLCDQANKEKTIGHLLPDPRKKSACKRSHLFLRWMVRRDLVDPGGWEKVSPSQLLVPLDTHMYKTGIMLGFTKRKSKDLKTAIEITQGFKRLLNEDPVKYDFCLTRFGIRNGMSMDQLKEVVCC